RRISFFTEKPAASSTNQRSRSSRGRPSTRAGANSLRRANATARSSTSVPKILMSWCAKAGPSASPSSMAIQNASSPVAQPAHHADLVEDGLDGAGVGRLDVVVFVGARGLALAAALHGRPCLAWWMEGAAAAGAHASEEVAEAGRRGYHVDGTGGDGRLGHLR